MRLELALLLAIAVGAVGAALLPPLSPSFTAPPWRCARPDCPTCQYAARPPR